MLTRTLGDPLVCDAADYSGSRRVRAYWTNVPYPLDEGQMSTGFGPVDANLCMDPGRTVEPYTVDGKTTIRTIGKSWAGWSDAPVADTVVPVVVHDVAFEKAQHLRPEEAEQILGFERGATAGRGVSAKDRLTALGDGWDLRTTVMINRFSKLATNSVSGPPFPVEKAQQPTEVLAAQLEEISQMDNSVLAEFIGTRPFDEQIKLLELVAHSRDTAAVNYAGSVLDSGSSRHLSKRTQVTDVDALVPLTGFNAGPTTWTQGNGYLPATITDTNGSSLDVDFEDTDKLDTVSCNILSMGKLVRKGWQFFFSGSDNMVAQPPHSDSKIKVELCEDDIIRFPHEIRDGKAATPIPQLPVQHVRQAPRYGISTFASPFSAHESAPVLAVHRTPLDINAEMLHDIFLHKGAEKIYRTLQNTKGYEAVRLPDVFCDICAKIKARRRGLSRKVFAVWKYNTEAAALVMPVQPDPVYDDEDELDAEEPERYEAIE